LCFLGLQAGRTLVHYKNPIAIVGRWMTWGILTTVIAIILCKAQKNDGWIPLNKNLWSLSYVLLMAGSAFIFLSLLYLVIDKLQIWRGSPFLYVGMNSILIYIAQIVFKNYFPFSYYPLKTSHGGLLLSNLIGVSCWGMISYYLYWKKILVKI